MAQRHTVRFEPVDIEIEVSEDETILDAGFRQGIMLAHGCKEGQCSACKSFLLSGEVELERFSTFALADYEQEEGYTLLCRAHAFTDLEVELLHYDEEMLTSGHPIRKVKTKVKSVEPLTHDIYRLSLSLDGEEPLEYHAGQYVDIGIPGTEHKRAFSMSTTPAAADRLAEELDDFKFVPALSEPAPEDNWDGKVGLITDVVDRLEGDLSGHEGYLCGPPPMIDAAISMLGAHGLAEARIFFDKFTITA